MIDSLIYFVLRLVIQFHFLLKYQKYQGLKSNVNFLSWILKLFRDILKKIIFTTSVWLNTITEDIQWDRLVDYCFKSIREYFSHFKMSPSACSYLRFKTGHMLLVIERWEFFNEHVPQWHIDEGQPLIQSSRTWQYAHYGTEKNYHCLW